MNTVAAVVVAPPVSSPFRDMPLRKLEGVSILDHLVTRIRVTGQWDRIVLLAPPGPESAEWVAQAGKLDIGCLQATETGLGKNLARAAEAVGAEHLLLLGSNHPLADLDYASTLVQEHLKTQVDYTITSEWVPAGTAPEVIRRTVLSSDAVPAEIQDLLTLTDHLKNRQDALNTTSLPAPWYLRNIHARLTVETEKDFEVAALLYGKFYQPGRPVALDEVIYFLGKNPQIASHNLPA